MVIYSLNTLLGENGYSLVHGHMLIPTVVGMGVKGNVATYMVLYLL